jgi:hypothetical protein
MKKEHAMHNTDPLGFDALDRLATDLVIEAAGVTTVAIGIVLCAVIWLGLFWFL